MTRVLYLDDEPINYQLVAKALQSFGYEVEYAENGNSGIAKARQNKPDLIIERSQLIRSLAQEAERLAKACGIRSQSRTRSGSRRNGAHDRCA